MSYLDKIMCPHSLAVIGASNKEHTIGSDIMKRLVEYGFTGKIFPINPKDSEIQGMKAYPSVLEVPEEIDMAGVVIKAKKVLSHGKESKASSSSAPVSKRPEPPAPNSKLSLSIKSVNTV